MSPLGYSKSSATKDEEMEEISGYDIETGTKSTNDCESPGPIMCPFGHSESSAINGEWKIPTKFLTHAGPKQLTHQQSMNEYMAKHKRAGEDQDPSKLNHSLGPLQMELIRSLLQQ